MSTTRILAPLCLMAFSRMRPSLHAWVLAAAAMAPERHRSLQLLDAPAPDDDSNLALLQRRIEELKAVHRIPCIYLPEVLLPRQRMRLSLPSSSTMLLQLLQETDTIGVVGARETSTGVPLTHGVEVRATLLHGSPLPAKPSFLLSQVAFGPSRD